MYLQIKDDNLSAKMFLGKCHPDLLFILIEMEIYSLLQLKLRKKKLMDVDFRAVVYFIICRWILWRY